MSKSRFRNSEHPIRDVQKMAGNVMLKFAEVSERKRRGKLRAQDYAWYLLPSDLYLGRGLELQGDPGVYSSGKDGG